MKQNKSKTNVQKEKLQHCKQNKGTMKITAVITEEKLIHEKINDDYKLSARLE